MRKIRNNSLKTAKIHKKIAQTPAYADSLSLRIRWFSLPIAHLPQNALFTRKRINPPLPLREGKCCWAAVGEGETTMGRRNEGGKLFVRLAGGLFFGGSVWGLLWERLEVCVVLFVFLGEGIQRRFLGRRGEVKVWD